MKAINLQPHPYPGGNALWCLLPKLDGHEKWRKKGRGNKKC